MAAVADPETQLAWEARQRPRAAVAAIIASLLGIAGALWLGAAFRDSPTASFVQSLAQALEPGPIADQPSVRTEQFQFFDDHLFASVGSSVVRAIAAVALGWLLTFLAAATRARRPELPRVIVYVGLVGAVLVAVAQVLGAVGTAIGVSDFLAGTRTVGSVADSLDSPVRITASLITQLASLALAAGLLLVSLNAMRVGLLTRFLGVLGIISGVLTVLPQLMPVPVIQSFWLIATGLMLLGTTRGGPPPAWVTGNAEPWPSQREVAEARRAQKAQRSDGAPAPEPAPEPVPAGRAHPASKKRKRKRRG